MSQLSSFYTTRHYKTQENKDYYFPNIYLKIKHYFNDFYFFFIIILYNE